MSKDIKSLLAQKLAENSARHANANQTTHLDVGSELKRLSLDKIQPNPFQPRTVFDEKEIASLAESIKEMGLLQPITVRETSDGNYELIAGERRLRACQLLGKTQIDAIATQADDSELAILALAENTSREDLCDYEIGQALRTIEKYFPNKSRLAEAVGLNREDMYRYFSYEALPGDFLAKLAAKPQLLSRSAATQIKQALAELQWSDEKANDEMLKVWALLEAGNIEQTKIAAYLRQQKLASDFLKLTNVTSRPILSQGKSVGKIQHKGKKFVLELQSESVTSEQQQAIEKFVNQLLNPVATH